MTAQPSTGIFNISNPIGQALSASRSRKWRHPWQTAAAWHAPSKQWIAQIEAGFVNEQSPAVRTTVEEQELLSHNWWGIERAIAEGHFSEHVFSRENTREARREELAVPLYLSPALPLGWRALGFDGPANSTVPQFFKDRGAADAPKQVDPLSDEQDLSQLGKDPPPGLRLLRATDVILHQPRLALTSHIALLDGPATGISNVTQTLSVRSIAADDALRVFTGKFSPPQATIDGLAGGLLGIFEEATWDELLIATIFMLSPPNTPRDSEPDGTWQPYVRHGLFWNLSYRTPTLRILDSDPGLPVIPPLAGGAAQVIINFLTATINDAYRQAINILTAHSMAGSFWTPTGGGHDAVFPEELALQQFKGLDRAKRLEAERLEKKRVLAARRLDPAFPYRAVAFHPSLLAA